MNIKKSGLWIMAAACLLMGNGCATMSASECQNADWETIGFEDGSKGRLPSHVGKHRKACAKHNITPNLGFYLKGHAQGVKLFCTESNGIIIGKKGTSYNGVCPAELSERFLNGYHIGKQFYAVSHAIDQLESSVQSDENYLEELQERLEENETLLIHENSSKDERRHLLEIIKDDQREMGRVERNIRRNRRYIADREDEYEQLELTYSSF
ncbi:MAG: DUF2799 domain-containing protein [Desulfobacterium sp.]